MTKSSQSFFRDGLIMAIVGITVVALPVLAAEPVSIANEGSAPTTPVITHNQKMFNQFGGKPGLTRLMDDFMERLVADPRTRPFFIDVDQPKIKRLLVEQFCVILDGGCIYSGRSMKEAHEGMGLKETNFYALVEDLQKSMNKFHIPFNTQNRLLAALAPQHRDMISK